MAASAARPRALPGALSGHGHRLSPGECPRRPLSPARHLLPVMRGPLPPWSLELWGRAAGHWAKWLERRRPLRPDRPTAKDRGQAPRRWLWSSRGWPVSGQDAGPGRLRAGSPTRSLPRGNGPHPGHIRPAPQGPWGRVRGTGSSPRHPEVRSFSRGPHLPARLPPRHRQSAREQLGTWGREEGPATVPRQVGRARAGGTHAQGPGLPGGLGPETCLRG